MVAPVQSASAVDAAPKLTGVVIVKKTATVADFQRVTVYCPDGKYAIGGGGEATAPSDGYDAVGLVGSFPQIYPGETKSEGWVANAHNFYGEPITVTAWAVCATMPQGYEVVQTPALQVPSDQPVTVSCPAGKAVLGGGGEIQGDGSSLTGSFPKATAPGQPTHWVVAGHNRSNSSVGVVGYAMCADPIADVTWTTYKATKPNPSGGFLTCPTGRYVSGGGASSSGQDRVLSASGPGLASEGAVRDGWWVQAGYFSDDPFATDLYVMCSTR
ncbi:hypothetical protein [Streptomyces xanthophaeus]